VTVKRFIDVKISISNKCCSFELSISSRNPENSLKKKTQKTKKTNVFSIDNNKKCFLTTKSAYYNE